MVTNAMATCLRWGLEGREELRAHRPHTGTSEQDPRRWLPLGLAAFCPPLRTLPARSLPAGETPLPPPAWVNGWPWPPRRLWASSRYKRSPLPTPNPTPTPSPRQEGRKGRRSPGGGGVGLPSKVGEGQLGQGPHCTEATRRSQAGQASRLLPGPGTRIPLGLSHPSSLAARTPAGPGERGPSSGLSPAPAERSPPGGTASALPPPKSRGSWGHGTMPARPGWRGLATRVCQTCSRVTLAKM